MESTLKVRLRKNTAPNGRARGRRKRIAIPALASLFLLMTVAASAQNPDLVAKAKAGDAAAQNSLGDYYYALNTPDGYTQSASWYRKAAEQGDAKAQYSLGISYCWHEGVPQDYARAYVWLDLAIKGKIDDRNHWLNYAASHLTQAEISQAQEQAHKWLRSHTEKSGA